MRREIGLVQGAMGLVRLIELDRCREGGGTFVARDGFELAVFRLTAPERVVVIDNACPHAAGNLSGGEVEGSVVTCPWHHWQFDLDRGTCVDSPRARLRRYRAEVREGAVWVELPAPQAAGTWRPGSGHEDAGL